jgi:hypothetical protein
MSVRQMPRPSDRSGTMSLRTEAKSCLHYRGADTLWHGFIISTTLQDMSATSAWIPVSSALAALFGGAFGAMLQGRYSISGWRRQTRLEAFIRFEETLHDFDDRLADALDAIQEPDFDDRWKEVRDTYWHMLRAHSQIEISGPSNVDLAAQKVVLNVQEIMNAAKNPAALSALAALRMEKGSLGSYEKWSAWVESVNEYAVTARKALRTQGWLPFNRRV